ADDSFLQDLNEALKLGKSVSLTKAEITKEQRRVYETHKRLVTERLISSDETDESQGELAHRPTGRRKPKGVTIRDTPRVSKKKLIDQSQKLKGIHQSGGSSEGAGSTDDETFLFDDKDEPAEEIPRVSIDEDEEDDESIDIENIDDERTESDNDDHEMLDAVKTDIAKEHGKNAEKVEEQKVDEEFKADEEHQGNVQTGDEQVGVPVSTTHKEKPNLLHSTSSHSISSKFGNYYRAPTAPVLESKALTTVLQRVFDLEKDVKELKQVDHSTAILESAIFWYHSSVDNIVCESGEVRRADFLKKDILFKMTMASNVTPQEIPFNNLAISD
ncbi:hypothetical protein Tco_1340856, partial [Tanacetum coccineum]